MRLIFFVVLLQELNSKEDSIGIDVGDGGNMTKKQGTGNAYRVLTPRKRVPKQKMTYNKRLLSKMRTRLQRSPIPK